MNASRKTKQTLATQLAISACLLALGGCKTEESRQNNFRAQKGWFFAKEHAALIFLPWWQFGNNTSQQNTAQNNSGVTDTQSLAQQNAYCSYYLTGKMAKPGEYDYLNVSKAELHSPQAFTAGDMFAQMVNKERADKNPKLYELASLWASGASSLSGDFLAEHQGKIEGTVIATALVATTAAIGCVAFHKGSQPCIEKAFQVGKLLTSQAQASSASTKRVIEAADASGAKKALFSGRKFKGFASVLKFTLTVAAPPAWLEWVNNDTELDTAEDLAAMDLLVQKLNDAGVKQRAEQKLAVFMENSIQKIEQLSWDDLQVLTQISFAEPNEPGLLCPKPRELSSKVPEVARYLGADGGWAKEK